MIELRCVSLGTLFVLKYCILTRCGGRSLGKGICILHSTFGLVLNLNELPSCDGRVWSAGVAGIVLALLLCCLRGRFSTFSTSRSTFYLTGRLHTWSLTFLAWVVAICPIVYLSSTRILTISAVRHIELSSLSLKSRSTMNGAASLCRPFLKVSYYFNCGILVLA